MSSQSKADGNDRAHAGAILLGCVGGFLAGEVVASLLISVGVQVNHFPGGLSALSHLNSPPWWSNVLGLIGLWVGFGAAIWFARTKGNLPDLPRQWTFRPSDVVFVVLGVGCQFLIDLIYLPFHFKNLDKPTHHLFGGAHGFTFVLLGVLTALGAPFFEEWFFRGVIFRSLESGLSTYLRRGATVAAMVLSALVFALAHGEPLQFLGLALLGVVLAMVVKRTQRLAPSFLTHASFNCVALVSLILQRAGH